MEYDDDGNEIEETDEQEEQGQGQPQRTDAEWAALRREKKKNKELTDRIEKSERESVFAKVGLDTNVPILKLFADSYKGELTKEAIEASAKAYGLQVSDDSPADNPTAPEQRDLGAQQRINAANAGSSVNSDNVYQRAEASLKEAFESGGTAAMTAKMIELGMPVNVE